MKTAGFVAQIGLWLLVGFSSVALSDVLLTELPSLPGVSEERQLRPVPLPEQSGLEPEVLATLVAARADTATVVVREGSDLAELARAYGELGELYHAHHVYVPADPCYRNARALDPQEFRWPYYLGYLAEQTGDLEKARENFERALQLRPGHEYAQLRLALTYIDLNELQLVAPLLAKTVQNPTLRAASLFGLGRVALAQHDFRQAANQLEAALAAAPNASRIHYPLAIAYRQLGDIDRARVHLAQHGDGKPDIADPMVRRLDALLRGARTRLHRAINAVRTGRYDVAATEFAAALELDPDNTDLRVSLARAQYLAGDAEAARGQLYLALEKNPSHGLAHFMLGLLLQASGSSTEAEQHYRATLRADPEHSGANHFLGDALTRRDQYAQAARYYARAVAIEPRDFNARIGEATALMRAGAPHSEVRKRVEEGLDQHPEHPTFKYLLARLLAASPEQDVRDGPRAKRLAQSLFEQMQIPETAETLAMAHAELGEYETAAQLQDQALMAAWAGGRFDLVPRLQENLARYQNSQPCRAPWADDDPMLRPMAVDPHGPFRDYPTRSAY